MIVMHWSHINGKEREKKKKGISHIMRCSDKIKQEKRKATIECGDF